MSDKVPDVSVQPEVQEKPPEDIIVPDELASDGKESWGERKNRLEALKCWPEVKNMIENSISPMKIARYIQDVRGELKDITRNAVRITIYKWINEQGFKLATDQLPTKHLSLINSSQERVDPLDAANMIFAIQMDRILLDYGTEKKIGKCLNTNTSSLKLATDMIKTISEIQGDVLKYKLKKGDPKDPKETIDQLERIKSLYLTKFGQTAATVALTDESRRRVFNALQKLRKGNSEEVMRILKGESPLGPDEKDKLQ